MFGIDSDKSNNPFAELMNSKPMRSLQQMMLPDIDKEALLATQKKDMDAMIEANRIMSEGQQANFKKLMGMIQKYTSDAVDTYTGLKDGGKLSSDDLEKKWVEISQNAFDQIVAAQKELMRDSLKYTEKADDVMNARMREKLGEIGGITDETEKAADNTQAA